MTRDIRCPSCSRLLGKQTEQGAVEIRYRDRYRLLIKTGTITCLRCECTVEVEWRPEVDTAVWGGA